MTPCGRTLVIGLGNPLRGDDGAGPAVVERLAEQRAAECELRSVPQLLPELAEPLAAVERAVFVDAAVDCPAGAVQVAALAPAAQSPFNPHAITPADLLALAAALYGRAPAAWTVRLGALQFDYGAPLSPAISQSLDDAATAIRALL